jgi:type III pantothenate kinase
VTTLLLDCGNTHTKAALWSDNTLEFLGHKPLADWQNSDMPDTQEVWVANTKRHVRKTDLATIFGGTIQVVTSEAAFGTLKNGYDTPKMLGVDRWLAMVWAWQQCAGACAVISLGTCVTIDYIAADGQHQGGAILPGFGFCREALGDFLSVAPQEYPPSISPATNTSDAVNAGCAWSVLAAIERVINTFEGAIWLTGGDAIWIKDYLSPTITHEPHMVLRGLSIMVSSYQQITE